MKPPYTITPKILELIGSVSEQLGAVAAVHLVRSSPQLRKGNRIKTIQASLAIEGNSLSEDQITAILENKRVLAPQRDILEVTNAIAIYDQLTELDPLQNSDLLKAHKTLMNGLLETPGKYRTGGVGIVKGSKVAHLAPPATLVNGLMKDLFRYLSTSSDPLLIRSCVFHYELQFIHPFADGNGRMGRLWQTLILMQHSPVFEFLPVESIVRDRQQQYYQSLSASDKAGESSQFIEFMLQALHDALKQVATTKRPTLSSASRMDLFQEHMGAASFSRKHYMDFFKEISGPTASRDLKEAVERKLLEKSGDKRLTTYRFVSRR